MIVGLGTHGTYYFFGGICSLMLLFSCFFIPETRGKTAAELHRLYDNNDIKSTTNSCKDKPSKPNEEPAGA